jgi:methylenetetrahydrofolate reductase (NADPH)
LGELTFLAAASMVGPQLPRRAGTLASPGSLWSMPVAGHPSQEPVFAKAIVSLTNDFTIEVTPKEVQKDGERLAQLLPSGARVYITFLANSPFGDTVAAVARLASLRLRPVPHLAARSVADERALDQMVGQLGQAGATELLVIAGSVGRPAGTITESMQVLGSGLLSRHGIERVGVAGHPEGSKDIGDARLAEALAQKNRFARESGLDMYLLTQFCFAADPIVEWEARIRAAGNRLPVHVGLAGLTSPVKLLKFGLACGVGPSLKVLRKQAGGVLKLAAGSVYYPDHVLMGLAEAVQRDPASLLRSVHFFPFGAAGPTVDWVQQLRAGRFHVDAEAGRVSVAGRPA